MEDEDGEMAQSLWPLVSQINIHFQDPITRLGIRVVDSPGTTDANKARRSIAQELRKSRTHAILVADAARAKDDQAIGKEMRLMRAKGPARVAIAIPKSDRIGDTTRLEGSSQGKNMIRKLRNEVKKYEDDLNAINCQIAAATSDSVRAALAAKSFKREIQLKLAQNAEKAHRIKQRSLASKRSLQDQYRSITGHATPVTVLAISNTVYRDHREGFYAKQTPVLSLEESNIPALRRFIYNAPNEARKNEAKHQHEALLPGLFDLIDLFTNRTVMGCTANLEEYVRAPLAEYGLTIGKNFEKFGSAIMKETLSTIKQEEAFWLKEAEGLCSKWTKFSTNLHLNLMKRDGCRAARGPSTKVNMTAQLIEITEKAIVQLFKKSTSQITQFQDFTIPELDELYSIMLEKIQNDDSAHLVPLRPFFDYVGKEKGRLNTAVRNAATRITDAVGEVRDRLAYEHENSYLVEEMLPIYAAIAALKGGKGGITKVARPKGGWPQYRKMCFQQAVCKPQGLFKAACERAEHDLTMSFSEEKQRLTEEVGAVFNSFLAGFDTMCAAKANDDPAEMQLREHLKKNLQLAKAHWDKPMREAVDSLTKNFETCLQPKVWSDRRVR